MARTYNWNNGGMLLKSEPIVWCKCCNERVNKKHTLFCRHCRIYLCKNCNKLHLSDEKHQKTRAFNKENEFQYADGEYDPDSE